MKKHYAIERKKLLLKKQCDRIRDYDKVQHFTEAHLSGYLKQGNPLTDVSLIYSGSKKLNKARYKSEMNGDVA